MWQTKNHKLAQTFKKSVSKISNLQTNNKQISSLRLNLLVKLMHNQLNRKTNNRKLANSKINNNKIINTNQLSPYRGDKGIFCYFIFFENKNASVIIIKIRI